MIDAPVSRGTRIYEKVVEKLKGEIAAGNILPGDPLTWAYLVDPR